MLFQSNLFYHHRQNSIFLSFRPTQTLVIWYMNILPGCSLERQVYFKNGAIASKRQDFIFPVKVISSTKLQIMQQAFSRASDTEQPNTLGKASCPWHALDAAEQDLPWQPQHAAIPAVPDQSQLTEHEELIWPSCPRRAKGGDLSFVLCWALLGLQWVPLLPCSWLGSAVVPAITHPDRQTDRQTLCSQRQGLLACPVPWPAGVCTHEKSREQGTNEPGEWELNLKQKLGEIKQEKAQEPMHGRQNKRQVEGTKKPPQTNKINKDDY